MVFIYLFFIHPTAGFKHSLSLWDWRFGWHTWRWLEVSRRPVLYVGVQIL